MRNIHKPSYFLEHADEICEEIGGETMSDKLKADMAAAKLLGQHPQLVETTWTEDGKIKYGKAIFTEDGEFTLSAPDIIVPVVKMLGEKYQICLAHTHADYTPPGWIWEDQRIMKESEVFETYTEAVRAAVMEVIG